ncbi:MAG: calcium-binding protein [Caldilineaceae bacterium]
MKVVVLGMADEADCMHEMFVEVEWQGRHFGVPLARQALDADDDSVEAIDDWKYWIKRGYQLV